MQHLLPYPVKNYDNDPLPRPPFPKSAEVFNDFAAPKSLLNWGANQVKWRGTVENLYPNLPVNPPAQPNTVGIAAVRVHDGASRAYTTPSEEPIFYKEQKPVQQWITGTPALFYPSRAH